MVLRTYHVAIPLLCDHVYIDNLALRAANVSVTALGCEVSTIAVSREGGYECQ